MDNKVEDASLPLLDARLDALTTQIGQVAQNEPALSVALYLFVYHRKLKRLAVAGCLCSRECGAHEVLLLSNNVIGKSRIHLKTFGITVGYE